MALTPDGIADGFTLTTFATTNPGNTGCCAGPFEVAVNSAGNVLVNTGSGTLYVFRDVDGQTPGSALFTQSSNNYVGAFTASGGVVYGSTFGGNYESFNPDGTVANSNVFPLLANKSYLGMWTNPVNGHIISNSALGLIDINPAAGNYTVITSSTGDGVSVSPDGKTAYSEQGSINGYDIATGTEVYSSGSQFPSPDGTGVITGGKFNGDIIVNDNSGSIYLLNPAHERLGHDRGGRHSRRLHPGRSDQRHPVPGLFGHCRPPGVPELLVRATCPGAVNLGNDADWLRGPGLCGIPQRGRACERPSHPPNHHGYGLI